MPREPGLRERKKRITRMRIEAAALELFARDGFDATTIEDIAEAADIAPRTFFSYFSTKEDVVLADYADRLARIVEHLDGRPRAEPPWAAVRAAFLAVAADYETERRTLVTRFRIVAGTPSVYARSLQLQAGWEEAVAACLARRTGRTVQQDITPRLLAAAALAAMRSALGHWLDGGQEAALPGLVTRCFDELGRGLADIA